MRSKAFVRSLIMTSFMSFLVPLLMIGCLIVMLALISYVPGLAVMSQASTMQILQVLATFGNGDAISGAVVIALVFMLVGALFDTYNFHHRSL